MLLKILSAPTYFLISKPILLLIICYGRTQLPGPNLFHHRGLNFLGSCSFLGYFVFNHIWYLYFYSGFSTPSYLKRCSNTLTVVANIYEEYIALFVIYR